MRGGKDDTASDLAAAPGAPWYTWCDSRSCSGASGALLRLPAGTSCSASSSATPGVMNNLPWATHRMASISCALSARLFRSPLAPSVLGPSDKQGVLAPRQQAPEVPVKGDQVLAGLRHRC